MKPYNSGQQSTQELDTKNAQSPGKHGFKSGLKKLPTARQIAIEGLSQVDDGAYANLALAQIFAELEDPKNGYDKLDYREKAFATELLYGTVRMRRAVDWIASRHIRREPHPIVERLIHLGVYQLVFLAVAPHAAVDGCVALAPDWGKGFINAVLRSVARELADVTSIDELGWPDIATQLSYPDWILSTLTRDLGAQRAQEALFQMNNPAIVHHRDDNYVQDLASQSVGAQIGVLPGQRVLDMCAAPGGKATYMAQRGARVTCVELHEHRCQLIYDNVVELGLVDDVTIICGDATKPLEGISATYDHVLVDAPCSGVGSMRRRPDARWRMSIQEVESLVDIQKAMVMAARQYVEIGGTLTYSVCTLTAAETIGIDQFLEKECPEFVPIAFDPNADGLSWEPHGRGAIVLPGESDGMALFRYTRIS